LFCHIKVVAAGAGCWRFDLKREQEQKKREREREREIWEGIVPSIDGSIIVNLDLVFLVLFVS
jgi:hypothetical protein